MRVGWSLSGVGQVPAHLSHGQINLTPWKYTVKLMLRKDVILQPCFVKYKLCIINYWLSKGGFALIFQWPTTLKVARKIWKSVNGQTIYMDVSFPRINEYKNALKHLPCHMNQQLIYQMYESSVRQCRPCYCFFCRGRFCFTVVRVGTPQTLVYTAYNMKCH